MRALESFFHSPQPNYRENRVENKRGKSWRRVYVNLEVSTLKLLLL
jgi:hypothetical protein